MKKLPITLLLLLLASFPLLGQQPQVIMRSPSLSPTGDQIAFSLQGDIWVVPIGGGQARRLTVHDGYDGEPKWSADGAQIAFSSDRYGNDDIYAIPVKGGVPMRLTYHAAADKVSDWTPDGHVMFSTKRLFVQIEREDEIHLISGMGGTSYRYLDALGSMASMSPDGQMVAFVRGHCPVDREAYRGPANREIWIFHVASKQFQRITEFNGNDFLPAWGGKRSLFFISASTGRYNVFQTTIGEDGKAIGTPKAVTNFKDEYGPQHFDVDTQGNTLVFERFGELFTQAVSGGTPKKLDISVTSDYHFDPVEHLTLSDGIVEHAASPNGKLIAFGIRGEIFIQVADKDKKRSVNVSQSPFRDRDPVWLNDSTLIFVSDRDGQNELYVVRSSDKNESNIFKSLKHEVTRLSNSKEPENQPKVSPDGKKMAFLRGNYYGNSALIVADLDTHGKITSEKTLHTGWQSIEGLSWSPDSRWLAYAMEDLTFNEEIYIQPADNSREPANISLHPRRDGSPVWSADGSKLAFTSERGNSDFDVWFVWLRRSDWEKTQHDWEEDDEIPTPEEKAKSKQPIQIDFDHIHYRLERVTSMPGNESDVAISLDGKTFFFTAVSNTKGGNDLYSAKWDGKDIKALTTAGQNPSSVIMGNSGTHLFFLQKGVINNVDIKASKTEALPHVALLSVDHPSERKQIFEEAWLAIDQGFYDPEFHGQDWKKLKKDFSAACLNSSTKRDFRYYFNLMLGQLNASHMGMFGDDEHKTQKDQTGLLGVEVMPLKEGIKITKVLRRSPADREQSKLMVGDILKKVDGQPVSEHVNLYSLFINTANTKVLLELERGGKTIEMAIRPVSSLSEELYEEWIDQQQAMVDKFSGGQLGYIHIQGMDWPSFERFERELTASGLNKKGIVIDVRYNGGGWTADYLMAALNVRQHAYTIPRGAVESLKDNAAYKDYYPFGERLAFGIWNKPSVAMCNEASYSNAEIFSHAYKSLGIGKLVGKPTFGAVISTGATALIDGSRVRMPFRAWFVKNSAMNMENGPAVPDVVVDNIPDTKAKGEDAQLKKAVEVLMESLKK